MAVRITGVEYGSAAHKKSILPGHTLVSIDGNEITDVLDYRFYSTEQSLSLALLDEGGKPYTISLRKPRYDDLGLEFDTYLMDKQRYCKNKCVFCFIDQMPPGMRESLYFKDDDSRMSFLFGNYITLTNLEERDIERIIKMHISPVNISVHTTDPELRVEMMKNPQAGKVLSYLPRLVEAGISVNAQIVLCPEVNDGPRLERSLRDLLVLAPGVQSVAVVPVGLTRYRDNLPTLRSFTKEEAARVLDAIGKYGDTAKEKHGQRTFYAADEFYLLAEQTIPEADYYEEFAQLENGVGLLSLLKDEFADALENMPVQPVSRRATIATGKAAYPFLKEMADLAMKRHPGLTVGVEMIENHFFGPLITVAGLVTGTDLLEQLRDAELGEELVIPAVMLRNEGDLFLDSMRLEELETALGVPIRPVNNNGQELLDAMLGN